jgi:hypothetical protein
MNKGFPVPRESSGDYLDEDQSVVCRFVYEELFPNVVVVLQQSPVLGPPPVDVILGQDASGQDFIIKRRKLSYLGNIVRSWQRSVRLPTTMVTVPMIQPVRDALVSTALTFIHYKHHNLEWRSSFFIKAQGDACKLVFHLANDGFLYIPDVAMETVPWGKPNLRHPTLENGWAVLKTSRREEAFQELQDFKVFADHWFGEVAYEKVVLYHSVCRRIDICFKSKDKLNNRYVGLEFSFERDWPVPDESDIWF